MRIVSTEFKNAMKAPVKEIQGVIVVGDGDEITSGGDLIKYTVEGGAIAVGKSALRKLTAEYLGTRNLVGQNILVKLGVRIASGEFEYMDVGRFIVTQCETVKDRGTTTLTGYDLMIYSILPYQKALVQFPTTVGGLYEDITNVIGVEPQTLAIPFNALDIESDLYENIRGTTYRTILEEIAILGGSIAMINSNNQIELRNVKTPSNTMERIDYDDLKKLKIKTKYGAVNSLVLSRQPQEDNVVLQNAESIEENGITEIKIINNEIIDKRRETVAEGIFPYFDGTEYYPFEAETVGLGWYEIGDRLEIEDEENVVREVRIMGTKWIVDGGFKETIWSEEPTKTETNYARAGGLDNRIRNTELIVDKQQQEIIAVITDISTVNEMVNENFTIIQQTIDGIIQSVQTSGGINLLRNSAFYQYDDSGVPTSWDLTGSGTFNIQASVEAISKGSLSGNVITLAGVSVKQNVKVVMDNSTIPSDQKTYYSFKTIAKKGVLGTLTVRIYNDTEVHEQIIPAGIALDFEQIKFEGLLPVDDNYTVELIGSSDSDATFTDSMLSIGQYPSAWTQANGEILNTNVNINEHGIIVKSSVYQGDYTAITPLEFSGYAKIGSTTVRAFTLNKDQTEVTKLKVAEGITMMPFKIVPITTGSVTGWAFVKQGND